MFNLPNSIVNWPKYIWFYSLYNSLSKVQTFRSCQKYFLQKCTFKAELLWPCHSVWQDWTIFVFKVLPPNFLTKVSQIFWQLWAILKTPLFNSNYFKESLHFTKQQNLFLFVPRKLYYPDKSRRNQLYVYSDPSPIVSVLWIRLVLE